jgi:hypothetical protein
MAKKKSKQSHSNLFLFILALFLGIFYFYKPMIQPMFTPSMFTQPAQMPMQMPLAQMPTDIQVTIAQDYTDTLKNVYAPPIRYRETEFRQLGYLTATNRERLPLFGRVLNRRDKWAYYTLEQGIKLPIEYNRRMCTQSPGCDSLSSGDEVTVEGMPYKVNLYESFLSGYS